METVSIHHRYLPRCDSSTFDLLASVIRIPGMPTGTGSNFVPGETFSTQRTNPAAPRAFAVSETCFIDAEPITKLKE